jgi:hypothetical protein
MVDSSADNSKGKNAKRLSAHHNRYRFVRPIPSGHLHQYDKCIRSWTGPLLSVWTTNVNLAQQGTAELWLQVQVIGR